MGLHIFVIVSSVDHCETMISEDLARKFSNMEDEVTECPHQSTVRFFVPFPAGTIEDILLYLEPPIRLLEALGNPSQELSLDSFLSPFDEAFFKPFDDIFLLVFVDCAKYLGLKCVDCKLETDFGHNTQTECPINRALNVLAFRMNDLSLNDICKRMIFGKSIEEVPEYISVLIRNIYSRINHIVNIDSGK